MQILHWQSDSRYYHAELSVDLFDASVLALSWGGIGRRPHRLVSRPYGSPDEAATALRAVVRRRAARGYSLVYEVRPHDPRPN